MKTVYIQYNRERLPQFQTETAICQEGGRIWARKRPLHTQAVRHMQNMYQNYLLLCREYSGVHIAAAEMGENSQITFEYIAGQSFETRIVEALVCRDKDQIQVILQQYVDVISKIGAVTVMPVPELFGVTVGLADEVCLNTANIDLSFSNIFHTNNSLNQYSIIDYEWVFKYIPVSYILFRSVYHLYNHYADYFAGQFTLDQIYAIIGLTPCHSSFFLQVEQAFQQYVYGADRLYQGQDSYLKTNEYFSNIYSKSRSASEMEEWGRQQDETIIRQQQSIQEVSEQSLEQQQTINQLQQYITNYQNSRGYKFLCGCYRLRDFLRWLFRC
jgi:hypothetical protein